MRYAPEHKQATRERILTAAQTLFRKEGFAGASVERVMRAAGLTVGGFYAHFASKETLLEESVRVFFRNQQVRWFSGLEKLRGAEFLDLFVRRYLNPHIRDNMETGCIMPSVLSDLTRGTPEAREALAQGLETLAEELGAHVPGGEGVTDRQRALATVALLFGAMTLARVTKHLPLSDEILEAARAFLLAGGAPPPKKRH
ncbi:MULTISPECIES: TetR/AcrR family transcriptional regulator [unclassified Myxococcus]|uniref:TetR/AcrR family transcriptional regulator n=1 Tax=unclassified Myxococcus TaxID=2648731 RepID=UPI00157A3B72|nr:MULTISPECIES: TetR/AcrR family transcriptional regulator [unclassified Myxococcus]NTX01357.1 TetR/AcrR family transcriptional regulator [Myxococcus sp. CA040A]NTX49952.1 TetR/AcrR family transcriptional regulator [Myxococcus sp. CA039A]